MTHSIICDSADIHWAKPGTISEAADKRHPGSIMYLLCILHFLLNHNLCDYLEKLSSAIRPNLYIVNVNSYTKCSYVEQGSEYIVLPNSVFSNNSDVLLSDM